jgi:predicted HTH domain antitoxin
MVGAVMHGWHPKLADFSACYAQRMAGADVTIPVALPSTALAQEPAEAVERRLRLLWALDEIRAGRATRVRAAAWLGLPIDEFLALAEAHGLPAFDYDPDDFKSELASLT